MGLFDQIRSACATVVERSQFVRIDRERLAEYARSLPVESVRPPGPDTRSHYLGHGEGTVAFILTMNAINFGSGYFPHLRKRPGMSGYFTIATGLAEHFRRHGPIPAEQLASVTPRDCSRMFDQDPLNADAQELMDLFAQALRDLGHHLLGRFDGRFAGLVESVGRSAEGLVRELDLMPFFRDVASYQELRVPFYKRAQITAADLAMSFDNEGFGRFEDLDDLTIFADNLVPHTLRVDGVLVYDDQLLERINRQELIAPGSAEEVEIRANGLHAVELMVAELRRAGRRTRASTIDYLLWNRGQEPRYKAQPRHRARSVFY